MYISCFFISISSGCLYNWAIVNTLIFRMVECHIAGHFSICCTAEVGTYCAGVCMSAQVYKTVKVFVCWIEVHVNMGYLSRTREESTKASWMLPKTIASVSTGCGLVGYWLGHRCRTCWCRCIIACSRGYFFAWNSTSARSLWTRVRNDGPCFLDPVTLFLL